MLSIVLSFFNEADVIAELIRRLRTVLQSECAAERLGGYELIFVNDTSTDQSREMLQEEIARSSDIRLLNMARNFGVGACVLAGMDAAAGDLLVYMDADLQDPPETIPRLLEAWRNDPAVEVVHTVRRSRKGETAIKLAITRLGYWILKNVSTVNLQIEAGDFKLLTRRALQEMLRLREKNPFTRGLVCWIGFKQVTVIYEREARFSGNTKFPVFSSKVIRNFLTSALISFSDIPLQIASVVGMSISAVALLFSGFLLFEVLFGGQVSAWAWISALLLALSGFQLLTIGLLGLYIGTIYVESKQRPNYIVESRVGFPTAAGSV